jgi:hypothetical protein
MKRITAAILILTTLLNCNDDDNSSSIQENNNKVITKIKLTNSYEIGSNGQPIIEVEEATFNYDSDFKKLLSTNGINSSYVTKFIYDNNKLTKIEHYSGETISSVVDMYYTGEKLSHTLTIEDNEVTERHDYLYQDQKLIQENICTNSTICDGSFYKKFTYQNNNISKILDRSHFWSISPNREYKYEYTFENSKNPFTNLQPVIKLLYRESFNSLNENNVKQIKEYWNNDPEPDRTVTYTYTVDQDNYPTIVIGKDQNNREVMKIEYAYNQ